MLKKNLRLALLALACITTVCACKKIIYVVPNAVVSEYPMKAPMTVGLLIEPAVRDTWFKWHSTNARKRVDVPVGKLALDFGRASMQEAFEDFYVERYRDRRSEKGILVVLDRVKFDLEGDEVFIYADIHIEDEQEKEIFRKTYSVGSDEARRGFGIPFITNNAQPALEENTALSFRRLYRELVLDIYVMTGFIQIKPGSLPNADAAARNIEAAAKGTAEEPQPAPPALPPGQIIPDDQRGTPEKPDEALAE